jgi:hypothetical protein
MQKTARLISQADVMASLAIHDRQHGRKTDNPGSTAAVSLESLATLCNVGMILVLSSTLVLAGMILVLSSTLVPQYASIIVLLHYSTLVLQYVCTIVFPYHSTFVLLRMILIISSTLVL